MTSIRTHVVMRPEDNVATALTFIEKNKRVPLNQGEEVIIQAEDGIAFGHKFALVNIKKGTDIFKYGEIIGIASSDIDAGDHVHIHNVDGKRGRGDVNDES
ncbi:UxaA family hydrolase [Shouchella patagoniensis]|uniref:UxaA family hydrolase n=1 Tax=Shouchella patagoniensis TaxID=228576 RepID=UPI000994C6DA|nr:UxaA family hydrolase [Shouchella patagoniensis]